MIYHKQLICFHISWLHLTVISVCHHNFSLRQLTTKLLPPNLTLISGCVTVQPFTTISFSNYIFSRYRLTSKGVANICIVNKSSSTHSRIQPIYIYLTLSSALLMRFMQTDTLQCVQRKGGKISHYQLTQSKTVNYFSMFHRLY